MPTHTMNTTFVQAINRKTIHLHPNASRALCPKPYSRKALRRIMPKTGLSSSALAASFDRLPSKGKTRRQLDHLREELEKVARDQRNKAKSENPTLGILRRLFSRRETPTTTRSTRKRTPQKTN